MKTNIRFLVMIAVSLLTVLGMSAQEPFFLHKEGVKLTYADKDKKGKINSYTETTATKGDGRRGQLHRYLLDDGDGQ